jgi:hypothetical protein
LSTRLRLVQRLFDNTWAQKLIPKPIQLEFAA